MIAGVLAGAFAALFWGASDFLAVKPVREIGPFRTLFYGLPFAVVAVFAYVYFFEGFKQMPSGAIMLVLAASFFNFLALFSFYSSFEKGLLSITSPISAVYNRHLTKLDFQMRFAELWRLI